jgi:hypothetical protein
VHILVIWSAVDNGGRAVVLAVRIADTQSTML